MNAGARRSRSFCWRGRKGRAGYCLYGSGESFKCGTPAGPALFVHQQQHQQHPHRRSSSVPLPKDYYPAFSGTTFPSGPFLPTSGAPSPVSSRRVQPPRLPSFFLCGCHVLTTLPPITVMDQCQRKPTYSPSNQTTHYSQKSTRCCLTLLSSLKVRSRNHRST